MDPVSISSLVISIAVAIGFLINKIHLKHCKMGCIDSDCRSPNNSPNNSINDVPNFNIEEIVETLKSARSINDLSVV
jgi:hypothetical protein